MITNKLSAEVCIAAEGVAAGEPTLDGNLRLKLREKHEDSQIGAGGKARV